MAGDPDMDGHALGRAGRATLGAVPRGRPELSPASARRHGSGLRPVGNLALVAVLLAGLWLAPGRGGAGAQGTGTPQAAPETALPPARCAVPTPGEAAGSDGTDIPVPSPVPAASPAPGQPADPTTVAEVGLVARALAACLGAGDPATTIDLTTPAFRGVLAGTGQPLDRAEYLAIAAALPVVPVAVRAVEDVRVEGPDRASAEVTYVYGNQLLRGRWTFRAAPVTAGTPDGTGGPGTARRWQVDAEEPMEVPVPAGAATLPVRLTEHEITTRTRVDGPDVVLEVANRGDEEHEALALRLDEGAEPADLLRQPGPGLPDGIAFAGQVTVPPGAEATLTLVDLAPGRYALVCLFPDEEGTPHLALGEVAELAVR